MDIRRRGSISSSPSILVLRIPWDAATARGFLVALLLHIAAFFVALHVSWEPQQPQQPEVATIPIELLTLGWGEGSKPAGGDLVSEGTARGTKPSGHTTPQSHKTGKFRTPQATEPQQGIPQPAAELPAKALPTVESKFTGQRESPQGLPEGTGLGRQGTGSGKGLGIDIEWGGGGNRIVLSRVLPTYPRGYNVSGRVRLRFTVLPDGTVGSIIPIQRSDPVLERAAIEALRQWRFNPLSTPVEMVGVITFTFELE